MLSPKQEKFCIDYAKTGNARQAYINAGYKCKKLNVIDSSASQLLKNPKVQNRLAELYEDAKNNSIADIQEMQQVLTKIIRMEAEEEVVISDMKGGASKTAKKPALKDVINAVNTLGKMQGAFIEKVDVTAEVSPIVIKDDVEV